ncbi:MAG TPA: FkbM family methyltransferase [Lacibacter sp.]|nr:FkbM family methyltransferase [Lacibacter sp.]HMO90259.1 FkbM family methyltransferase [Lacibacter sp.]
MKKIVRIAGLIQLIRQKKQYSRSIRRQLIRTLLWLEYGAYRYPLLSDPVTVRILHYRVTAFGYANLCLLFREIFVNEDYRHFHSSQPRPVIADCGANIGMATLYLKWKFPHAVIHAFEPDPAAFALLEQNVRQNGLQDVHLHHAAVMDKAGSLTFYVSKETKASLMMSTQRGRMNEEALTVDGVDFPAFLRETSPALLKMDIEGAETGVFTAMAATGTFASLQQIILEYHHGIEGNCTGLAGFLQLLENEGFWYNLHTHLETEGSFQDILVVAQRF